MSKQKYTNNEIVLLIEHLTREVHSGFKGIHDRQDITNGNVKENTEFRLKTQGNIKLIKWLVGGGLAGIITILALLAGAIGLI